MNHRLTLALPLLTAIACGPTVETTDDAGAIAPDAAIAQDDPLAPTRSLHYLATARACMSDGDARVAEDLEGGFRSCTTDADCPTDGFAACRHLEDADNPPDLTAYHPALVSPPAPTEGDVTTGYWLRYVPLCADGSGDHEHALGLESGVAPTCEAADYIRCADGNRPYYYTNVANSGDSATQWLLWAGSGGYSLMTPFSGWVGYQQEPNAFSLGAPLVNRAGLGGVFADNTPSGFGDFHRVFVEKCTPDRFQGRATRVETQAPHACDPSIDVCTGTLEPPLHDETLEYNVYLHGSAIVEAVITDLSDPTPAYSSAGDVVETLPALADAEGVVLSCHSNGCNGLQMTVDERAAQIRTVAPTTEVRVVFNNFMTPALEGEHALLENTAEAEIDDSRSFYDGVTTGTSISGLPVSTATFADGGESAATLERYGAILDASCLASHADDPTLCRDSLHVLMNHLGTEFFYILAQTDGALIDGGGVTAPYCDGNAVLPFGCPFTGAELGWTNLVRKQIADLANLAATDRCEADSGPAPYDRVGVWAPRWGRHAGWQDNLTASRRLRNVLNQTVSTPGAVARWLGGDPFRIWLEDIGTLHFSARNGGLNLPVSVSADGL